MYRFNKKSGLVGVLKRAAMAVFVVATMCFSVDAFAAGYTCSTKKYTSCNKGYYLNGTTCTACPSGYPNSDGGTGGITSCYSNTKSRAWTGAQNNGSTPTGCASVTAWNSCSNPACDYVAYSNANGNGDGTIKSGCSTNSAACTKTAKTVTANANYYANSTTDGSAATCPACSTVSNGTYPKSDGGSITSAYCYKDGTKTGSQVDPVKPANCATMSLGTCTPGSCTYKDYYTATDTTCTPSDCIKPITALTANSNYYVNGTISCPACSTVGNGTYTKSDGGSITSAYCYKDGTQTGLQLDPVTPSGCGSKTLGSCTPGTCTYKDYYTATDTTCAPTNCTKPITAVSASANYYVSGTSCVACPSGYPKSDGGTGGVTQCYSNTKSRAWTGSAVNGTTPSGCASVTSWNSCSVAACDYVAYANSAGTGDGTIKSGCSTNSANCTKTPSAVTASSNYYVNGTSCTACPATYPKSDGGSISSAYCYKDGTNTGSQLDPATPSGCATKTLGTCTPGTCTYKDYQSATDTTCTPSNCTKPITAVTASSNYYVSGTSCVACPSGYPKSDGGSISSAYCYKDGTKTGSQVDPATPSGCASKTLGTCTPGTCTYKDYYTATDTDCTPTNCTKPITAVTASSNYYVSGTSCVACPATYPKSDGGSISSAYCYKDGTNTGSQVDPATPSGCATKTLGTCTPGTCTYKDYQSATDTTCTPTNCTKPITAVTANTNYYVNGTACTACPATYPKSDGGNISSAYCYKDGTTTGSQLNGATPAGCASVTDWYACTPGTCTYKDYQSATDTTCTPSNCTKVPKTVTASANYYANSTTNGTAATCPACDSGYSSSAGNTGGQSACTKSCTKACTQQSCPANATCTHGSTSTSGTQTQGGSCSASSSTCSITITCDAGYYKDGSACTKCPTAYPNSAAGSTAITQCYSGTKSRAWTGSQTTPTAPTGCDATWNDCSVAACSYVAYSNASGTGDGSIKSGCETNAASCTKTLKSVSAQAGYYAASGATTCTKCPTAYPNSAAGSAAITSCYSGTKSRAWTGTQTTPTAPTGCNATWNDCSVAACDYVAYSNASGNGDGTIKSGCSTNSASCTKTLKSVSAQSGYYAASGATTCTKCPTAYPNSAAGSTKDSDCTMTTTAGQYIANAKDTTQTTCPQFKYCPSATVAYGSVNTPSDCPSITTAKITSYPSNWYSPTTVNIIEQTWSNTGLAAITDCKVTYNGVCTRGNFTVESVRYNSSTGKYDTNASNTYWTVIKPGYYAKTQYSSTYCNTTTNRMLYKDALECPANSYCPGFTSMPLCSSGTYSDTNGIYGCPSGYPNSAALSSAITQCYSGTKSRAWTGSAVNGSVPNGCASVTTWNSCSVAACDYVAYANSAGTGDGTIKSGCSTNSANCTKTPSAVTASSNYYVNGTSCTACPATYPKSDGGSISSAYCYKDGTKTGSQVDSATPSGCASKTLGTCTPGTCTYKDYQSATDTDCTPTNCTKPITAVTASSNYYVSGTSCVACPSGYPNSAGGTGGVTQCYSNTKSRAWSGSAVNGSTPTGCASVTSWNSCSGSACDYVAYANSAGTADGTIKSGCSTNSANCTKTPAAVTASANYYVSGTTCPACDSGYTSSSGNTGGQSACTKSCTKACTQQSCPANATCAHGSTSTSGTQPQGGSCNASSSTCSITITCDAGYYKDGSACTKCPTAYPNSAAGSTAITQCYSGTKSRAWTGSQTTPTAPTGCDATWNACSVAACDYVAYSNASGTGDGSIKSGCETNASSCTKTLKSVSAQAGYYAASGATTCTKCPTAYPNSAAGSAAITSCYSGTKSRAWTGSAVNGSVPNGCASVTTWNSCSVAACDYVAYSNAAGTGDGTIKSGCSTNSDNCTKTPSAVTASANYYVNGAACTACPSGYPKSDGGNISSAYCYKDGTKTGSQVDPATPTGCASKTLGTCTPGTCTYKDYQSATDTDCTPTNCTKPITAVTANAGNYVSGTTCPACDSGYSSVAGNTGGVSACTKSCTKACTQQSCPANATCTHGSTSTSGTQTQGGSCSASASTCSITITCDAGYYKDGSACTKCPTAYPNSAAGSTAITQCYSGTKSRAWTGSQTTPTAPTGCDATWNDCSVAACDYVAYSNASGTGDGSIKSGCETNAASCTKTLKSVSAQAGYYAASGATTCTKCPTAYPNSAAGSAAITSCYSGTKSRAWTGSQTTPTAPTGCDATWNDCSVAACDYVAYSNAAGTGDGTIKSGCSTNSASCNKTLKSVSAQSGYYAASGATTCTKCPTAYPNSAAGSAAITSCYSDTKSRAWTGSAVNGSTPTGCASVTSWNSCSNPACDYVAYSNASGNGDGTIKSGCSTNSDNCTKTPSAVTASANYYVNGAACTACNTVGDKTYTKSDGGNITSAYCYKDGTKTGNQLDGDVPTGCASVTAWNACTPGTCTYKDYYTATDTTCTPTDCTKTVKTVSAKAGYFAAATATTCTACAQGSYSAGTGNTSCTVCGAGKTTSGTGATAATSCTDCTNTGSARVKTWATPTWSNNTVANLCTISACNACSKDSTVASCTGSTLSGTGSSTSCGGFSATCATGYKNAACTDPAGACSCAVDSVKCDEGKYLPKGAVTCSSCPAGKYCTGGTYTVDSTKDQGITGDCNKGTYSTGGASAATCTGCPANSTTASVGSTAQSQCLCNAGYAGSAASGSGTCTLCGVGTYKASPANGNCTACSNKPANSSYSGTGNTSSACSFTCNAGYYGTGATQTSGICNACGEGYYCTGGNARAACPAGQTTIGYGAGADEASDCGRILHYGTKQLYLRNAAKTTHSLKVNVGGTTYYGNMTTDDIGGLRVNMNSTEYSVYDDSMTE